VLYQQVEKTSAAILFSSLFILELPKLSNEEPFLLRPKNERLMDDAD
jgi:hypothetical protein